jgi:CO dehydrogenase/acetyl-CoA synthase beta subunit
MTVNLTPEQIAEILATYHAEKAIRDKEQTEAQAALDNFYAIMKAKYAPRIVTVSKPHRCSICDTAIQKGAEAWFSKGCIAAKSARCTDPTFTASKYTCLKCHPKE